jgi:Skp family chaperone for outer membrane proteins
MPVVAVLAVLGLTLAATPTFGQAQAPAAPPAAPPPAAAQAAPAPAPPRPFPEGSRLAFLNTQRVAAESAVGRAATAKLKALNDQKVTELTERQKQLEAQQLKLQQGASVLSEQAAAELQKTIDRMNVDIQRFTQDAQAEVQELNNQLQADFENRLRPIIAVVSQEKGLHMVFGPESGIVWADAALDITDDVIKRFDQPAPAAAAAPR